MPTKLIKLPEVVEMTALSRASIYAFIAKGEFPRPIKTGVRAVAWKEDEILNWIEEKMNLREG